MATDPRSWRLFADTRRVAHIEGPVSHRWYGAERLPEPVIRNDKPWEEAGIFVYGSVIQEQDRYRIWFQSRDRLGGNGHRVGYAESADGFTWTKPDLCLVEFEGSRNNNLTNLTLHLPSVGKRDDGSWWATGHVWNRASNQQVAAGQERPGVYLFESGDGLNWQPANRGPLWETPPDPSAPYGGGSDVQTVVHDPYRNQYIAASKFHVPYESKHRRAFAIRTSGDLHSWSSPEMALSADAQDDLRARELGYEHADFYGVTFHPYPGFLLGFVWVFYMEGAKPDTTWPRRSQYFGWQRHGHMAEVQTVFSYDGRYWMRTPNRTPLLSTGPRGSWDGGNVATANTPLLIGNQHIHYYGGGPVHHGATTRPAEADRPPTGVFTSIGAAHMKRDRYAAYSSSSGGSLVVMHGVRDGDRLSVNAQARYGSVRCEVLDAEGSPFPGFELRASVPVLVDDTDIEMKWEAASFDQLPADVPIALRFYLEEADLFGYSIWKEQHS